MRRNRLQPLVCRTAPMSNRPRVMRGAQNRLHARLAEQSCLRDGRQSDGNARVVRVIAVDRQSSALNGTIARE
jgi:hypothetical protein